MAVQLDGIGPSIARGTLGDERVSQLESIHMVADIFLGLVEVVPVAFPVAFSHFHHMIPLG